MLFNSKTFAAINSSSSNKKSHSLTEWQPIFWNTQRDKVTLSEQQWTFVWSDRGVTPPFFRKCILGQPWIWRGRRILWMISKHRTWCLCFRMALMYFIKMFRMERKPLLISASIHFSVSFYFPLSCLISASSLPKEEKAPTHKSCHHNQLNF